MVQNILVGVTGGVAAYKAVMLVRQLKDAGFNVRVVMTQSAQSFVAPLTFQACSGYRVYTDLIDTGTDNSMAHIELVRWADLMVIAPATANFIAKAASGFADDLLSTLCLATRIPVFMAPAMNCQMWSHPATQENIKILKQRNIHLIGPESGDLACGDIGVGRMSEPEKITQHIQQFLSVSSVFKNKRIVITAGPTHEKIDPIRYLGNRSSGKMGYALAASARDMGATVTLISGPTSLPFPDRVQGLSVQTALEMYDAVMQHVPGADVFISSAAVANYRMKNPVDHKIKSSDDEIQLELIKNPDIVSAVAQLPHKPFVVGFAAETQNVIEAAIDKLKRKNLDMIVANQVSATQGMGQETNSVTLIDRLGHQKNFVEMQKTLLAPLILREIKRAVDIASEAQQPCALIEN